MIANGIYHLDIVGSYKVHDFIRIHFRVLSDEAETICRDFPTARPAESLRSLLEACEIRVPSRRLRLNLDDLVGLELLGMIVGGQVIEFYRPADVPHIPNWMLADVGTYLM